MKSIFIFLGMCLFSTTVMAKAFHICHFSMNNPKEYQATQKFLSRFSDSLKKQNVQITASEYMVEGSDISKSFVDLVKSGTKCDGLILSGHHTSAFYGMRGTGKLDIDFLEKLSCSKDDGAWFLNVKVLWLQGCRTLGVEKSGLAANADAHTTRVSELLNEDDLNAANPLILNQEFSTMMDEDNPLASRYRRIFPMATVLGWTQSGPGVKARSENSFALHVAALSALESNSTEIPDPRRKVSVPTAEKFSQALINMLEQKNETQTLESWKWSGRDKKVGFGQEDISGYVSMRSAYNLAFEEAKKYDCLVKCSTLENLEKNMDAILANENLLGYTFTSLLDIYHELNDNKIADQQALASRLKIKLKNSAKFKALMESKILSPRIGFLRKIDYAGDYVYLYGSMSAEMNRLTKTEYKKQLKAKLGQNANQVELILFEAYKTSLVYRISQNFPALNLEAFTEVYPELSEMVFNYMNSQDVWNQIPLAQKNEILMFSLNKWPSNSYSIISRIKEHRAYLTQVKNELLTWVQERLEKHGEEQQYMLEALLKAQLTDQEKQYVLSKLQRSQPKTQLVETTNLTFSDRFFANAVENSDLVQINLSAQNQQLTALVKSYAKDHPDHGLPTSFLKLLSQNRTSLAWLQAWILTFAQDENTSSRLRSDFAQLTTDTRLLESLLFNPSRTKVLVSQKDFTDLIFKGKESFNRNQMFAIAIAIDPVIANVFMDEFMHWIRYQKQINRSQIAPWSNILRMCLDTRLLSTKDERFIRQVL